MSCGGGGSGVVARDVGAQVPMAVVAATYGGCGLVLWCLFAPSFTQAQPHPLHLHACLAPAPGPLASPLPPDPGPTVHPHLLVVVRRDPQLLGGEVALAADQAAGQRGQGWVRRGHQLVRHRLLADWVQQLCFVGKGFEGGGCWWFAGVCWGSVGLAGARGAGRTHDGWMDYGWVAGWHRLWRGRALNARG